MSAFELVQTAALLSAGAFTGGSLFISLVDHPARVALGPALGRQHFREMYPRATALQAPLAASGAVFGLCAWLLGGGSSWLLEGLCIGAVVPYTLGFMIPLNRRLMSPVSLTEEQTREQLAAWARRHAVRTVLGAGAFVTAAHAAV